LKWRICWVMFTLKCSIPLSKRQILKCCASADETGHFSMTNCWGTHLLISRGYIAAIHIVSQRMK
jgi:hypothetical protein